MNRDTSQFGEIRKQILQNTTGIIARHINKKISLPISFWIARHTHLRPNQITYFNILVGLLCFPAAAHGTLFSIFLSAAILQLASVLDGVDGEVAKLTGQASYWGQWLDTFSDNVTFVAFLSGLTIGLHKLYPHASVLIMSAITFLGFAIIILTMLIFLKKETNSGSFVTYDKEFLKKITKEQYGFFSTAVSYLKYAIKKDFFSFSFFLIALAGQPLWILRLSCMGVIGAITVLIVVHLTKKCGQLTPAVDKTTLERI